MSSLILSTEGAFFTLFLGSSVLSCSVLVSLLKKHEIIWLLLYPYRALLERVKTYLFLIHAPRIIQEGYDAAQGGPFIVNAPDIRYHLVADPKLIEEIDHAPNDTLSLQAAAKIMLRPELSMHNFDWFEQRGTDGTPLVKTLNTLLKNELPSILPKTRITNSAIMDDMLSGPGKPPHISKVVRACVARTNALAFFGEEFVTNEQFMLAAEDFIDKTVFIAEAARLLPGFVGRMVTRLLEAQFNAQHIMFDALVPVVQQRIDEYALANQGHSVPEHKDCMQWIMEQSARSKLSGKKLSTPWPAGRIVHELMALWFGAVHTMAMVTMFAVRDVCMHPEYLEPLRKELEGPAYQLWESTGNGLPLVDSFLKESARMNPLDNVSTRRKALKPFTLSNGIHVERGEWLATPLAPMLRDPKNWADPLEFHGFRHLDSDNWASLEHTGQFHSPEPEKASPLTDTRKWQIWGTGRMACPGRFYAAAGIKQIFSLILTKYDCEIVDKCSPAKYSWRTCNVPRSDLPIVVRRRAGAA